MFLLRHARFFFFFLRIPQTQDAIHCVRLQQSGLGGPTSPAPGLQPMNARSPTIRPHGPRPPNRADN